MAKDIWSNIKIGANNYGRETKKSFNNFIDNNKKSLKPEFNRDASVRSISQSVSILENTKNISTGVTGTRNRALDDIRKNLSLVYSDNGMSDEDITKKLLELNTTDELISAANELLTEEAVKKAAEQAVEAAKAGAPKKSKAIRTEDDINKSKIVLPEAAQNAVDIYNSAKAQTINPGEYFYNMDYDIVRMGDAAVTLNDLRNEGFPADQSDSYNDAIKNIQFGLATLYMKDGKSPEEISEIFKSLNSPDDYLNAVVERGDDIMNSKERVDENNGEHLREPRDWTFEDGWYTAPDGRQISEDNYKLMCCVVAHEAGGSWIGIEEKTKCAAGIMNISGLDTANIPRNINDPNKFGENTLFVDPVDPNNLNGEYYFTAAGQNYFDNNVTPEVEEAVRRYFCYPEVYDKKHIMGWYGDGVKNYFLRSGQPHADVMYACLRQDYFEASRIEYEDECIQRTSNRYQLGQEGFNLETFNRETEQEHYNDQNVIVVEDDMIADESVKDVKPEDIKSEDMVFENIESENIKSEDTEQVNGESQDIIKDDVINQPEDEVIETLDEEVSEEETSDSEDYSDEDTADARIRMIDFLDMGETSGTEMEIG